MFKITAMILFNIFKLIKKKIFFIVFFICISISIYSQTYDISDKIKPVFVYTNNGGYFYSDDGELTIFEAIFKKTNNNKKPVFIGYNKLYLLLNKSTVFLNSFPTIDFKDNSIELENLLNEGKLMELNENDKINFKYKKYDFELAYNNLNNDFFENKIFLYYKISYRTKYRTYNKTYILLKDSSNLSWYKVFNNYLILACQSKGGSGHLISLEIFDLDKMIKFVR
ncbi:MAG: hypothetical protein JXB50_12030 [Spirochaetes bacterium]|nr:hypothetical protein [Spirochaetota bacterium]